MGDGAALERDWLKYCRELLDRGDRVYYGYLDGKCVFKAAAQRNGTLTLSGRAYHTLGRNDLYVHAVYCDPAARRRGFHQASLRRLCGDFPDAEFLAVIKPGNGPSQRAFFRAGYDLAAMLEVDYRCFFRSALRRKEYTPEEARELIRENLEARELVRENLEAREPPGIH